jgi:hypothetical protein
MLSDGSDMMATMGIPVTGVSELTLEVVDLEAAEAFDAGWPGARPWRAARATSPCT